MAKPPAPESKGVLRDALRDWWAKHPMRVTTLVAAEAAKVVMRPLARRHPIALVMGALVLGGLIVWARPWRGLLKPALLAGMLPQLVSKIVAQLPVESWLAVLSSLTEPPASPGAAPTDATPPRSDEVSSPQSPLH
ncbi:MAG: hypothetical protein H7Y33_11425 [Cytophagales bacterium]|nr:hypothetical protein [Rhizobacter sp.]